GDPLGPHRAPQTQSRYCPPMLVLTDCAVDLSHQRVRRGADEVLLTHREAELLRYLVERRDRTVTSAELLREIWGFSRAPRRSTAVRFAVARLREKVEPAGSVVHLRTVPSKGYRFDFAGIPQHAGVGPPPDRTDAYVPGAALDSLADALQPGVLLTLTGPPGVGKTRLANELAQRTASRWSAVLHADLTAATTAPEVVRSIGRGVGLPDDARTSAADVGGGLAWRSERGPTLLVVDNGEQVLSALAAHLPEWRCDGLAILLTSRKAGVPGEQAHAVSVLSPSAAAELLALRCQEAGAPPPPAAGLAAVAERLEGVPLALELAAARLRIMRPEQLLERLASRPGVLRTPRTVLDDAIATSWELLQADERAALARLALVEAPFTRDAAAALTGRSDTADRLVAHSLLVPEGDRLRMLLAVRGHARARLEESGDLDAAIAAHAAWFARDAEGRLAALGLPGGRARRLAILLHRDDLRAITERDVGGDLLVGAAMLHAESEGAAQPLERIDDILRRATARGIAPHRHAWLLNQRCQALRARADLDAARTSAEAALALNPGPRMQTVSHREVGMVAILGGHQAEALAAFDRAAAVAHTPLARALASALLGRWHAGVGEYAAARPHFHAALAAAAGADECTAAMVRSYVGNFGLQSDADPALALAQAHGAVEELAGFPRERHAARHAAVRQLLLRGLYGAAERWAAEAGRESAALGSRRHMSLFALYRAIAFTELGWLDAADAAIASATHLPAPHVHDRALTLARLVWERSDLELARDRLAAAAACVPDPVRRGATWIPAWAALFEVETTGDPSALLDWPYATSRRWDAVRYGFAAVACADRGDAAEASRTLALACTDSLVAHECLPALRLLWTAHVTYRSGGSADAAAEALQRSTMEGGWLRIARRMLRRALAASTV
ncbi:MAG: putative ATPase/DNA-binding winged helix-turn-helix (wHTH) protein, partial [Myxococcota bacterium]